MSATVVTEPARPIERRVRPPVRRDSASIDGRRDVRGGRLDLGSASADRIAGAARSCVRIRCRRTRPRRRLGAGHELGRAAADVDHQVRRRVVGAEPADRTGERQPGLLVAGDHLRVAPSVARTIARKSSALSASRLADVATIRTRCGAQVRDLVGVVGQRAAGCARSRPRTAGRSGRRPRRGGRSPSGGRDRSGLVDPRGRRPAGGSSWCRSRSRPPASARVTTVPDAAACGCSPACSA